jgi:hypothetical protein
LDFPGLLKAELCLVSKPSAILSKERYAEPCHNWVIDNRPHLAAAGIREDAGFVPKAEQPLSRLSVPSKNLLRNTRRTGKFKRIL